MATIAEHSSITCVASVRKLDFGHCVLAFGKDKIIFRPKTGPLHYTFHFGPHSKIMDLHITHELTNERTRIFEMGHATVLDTANEIGRTLEAFLKQHIRTVNPNWLQKEHVFAASVEKEAALASLRSIKKRILKIDFAKLSQQEPILFELPEDLPLLAEYDYISLFSLKRRSKPRHLGIGFNLEVSGGQKKLYWMSMSALNRIMDLARQLPLLSAMNVLK